MSSSTSLDPSTSSKKDSLKDAHSSPSIGIINQHPPLSRSSLFPFRVGVSEDKNSTCRRMMEDCHCFIYDFAAVPDQGFFAIFDGHAGKDAAEFCGANLHEHLVNHLKQSPNLSVPEILNKSFHSVDEQLIKHTTGSGCTAVTAFIRLEDANGTPLTSEQVASASSSSIKRMLYTANVGDARAVLARKGKAVRLTYDHKGSDVHEAKRITDAGGFIMKNRVNGVLAVTRSLGDSAMKDFVVGAPYTTETALTDDDTWLVVACDGLWDVCDDQLVVDTIMGLEDPQEASQVLLDKALRLFSTDNLSVICVALQPSKMPLSPHTPSQKTKTDGLESPNRNATPKSSLASSTNTSTTPSS